MVEEGRVGLCPELMIPMQMKLLNSGVFWRDLQT